MEPFLTVWTIYENPSDAPGWFVVRGHDIVHGQTEPVPHERPVGLATNLGGARELVPAGLTCISRSPEDDPCVVESWI